MAYPRGCGEWAVMAANRDWSTGLPPRVRGMVTLAMAVLGTGGLTPAGAGNGRSVISVRSVVRAYPRGCGEWYKDAVLDYGLPGLPPRVRGMG